MRGPHDARPAAHGLLQQVLDALLQGQVSEAKALCEAAIASHHDDGETWFALGRVAMHERAYGDAARAFGRSLELHANPWACVYRALSLWELDEFEAALAQARMVVDVAPDFAEAHSTLALALHGLGHSLEAEAHARAAEILNPDAQFVVGELASILAHLDQLDEAEVLFRRAAKLAPSFPHYRMISFCRPLWDQISGDSSHALDAPQVVYAKGGSDGFGFVVMSCCDSVYLRKYGASFANSFAQNAARENLLHLHVLDPDDQFADYLSWLVGHIDLPRFRITTERSPLKKNADRVTRTTYYSCGRFMQMSRLLTDYGRPIVCFDIDATLQAPVQRLIEHTHGKDLGLIQREPPDSPWLDVVANIVVANPTAQSSRYFELVRNYVQYFMHRGKLFWHLDQIALYCVLKMMGRYAMAPQVAWIKTELRKTLWHIGQSYGDKMKDERYSRYVLGDADAPH